MENSISTLELQLVNITRQFLLEQEAERATHAITLNASLERQLGIDSLGKVELFHRIEKTFGVTFSDMIIAQAETLNDILNAISGGAANSPLHKSTQSTIAQGNQIDFSKISTLQDALIQHALFNAARPHIYFQEEDGSETIITYGELLAKAASIANRLIAHGIQPDDTVAIMLPTHSSFFYSFFGVLLAGAIPVPIYPPYRPDRIEEYAIREQKILNSAEVRALITFSQAEKLSKVLQPYIPSLKLVTTAEQLLTGATTIPVVPRSPRDISLIQYTSGSTGDPKGVLLHHENMIANIKSIGATIKVTPTDAAVSWLPLYHDMGLLSWISALYYGVPFIIIPTLSFLNRPERWLWAIHYHRATISAGPNFAYELCAKRISEEALNGLDLSSWRLALNGAEAVNPRTLERFYHRFNTYGFKKESLYPVYGLAENTVGLTFPELGRGPKIDKIDSESFTKGSQAIPTENDNTCIEFVSVGKAILNHEIRIVDEQDTLLAERHVGNIQFRGPSAMQGYYHNPKATEQAFHGGWWATGDRGYIADEELYITGRLKDIIIKAGRNLHPEPIEEIASNIAEVRKGCVVAFGIADANTGTEKMIIVTESKLTEPKEKEILEGKIIENVTIGIGIPPDKVIIVPPRSIPKTSSGKLQRSECKKLYLNGELGEKPKTMQWQMAKLFIQSSGRRAYVTLTKLTKLIYTAYIGVVFILTFIPTWLLVLITPQKMAHRLMKFWSSTLFKLIFCPIHVVHRERLTTNTPVIFVSNHASYCDSLVLLSILPPGSLMVGKKELLTMPFVSNIIKKLKFLTVDRFDFSKNLAGFQTIQDSIEKKESVLIFPEGTFSYAKGLRPFKVGAFQLAVNTQTPLCPLALSGTRDFLRSGNYLISHHRIAVTVCDAIVPQNQDWQEVVKLRNQVRKAMAENCGEPVIDVMTTQMGEKL